MWVASVALLVSVTVVALGLTATSPLALLIAPLGLLGALLVAMLSPEVLLMLLIASLPWESYLAYPSASLTVIALVRVLLPLLLIVRLFALRQSLKMPSYFFPLGAFLCLVLVSLMFSFDPGEGIVKTLRYAFFAASLFAAVQFLGSRRLLVTALRVLTISSSAAAIVALVGFLGGATTRAAGPIADPNSFAFLLVAAIPMAAFLFVDDRRWRSLWGAALIVLLCGTLATLSRGAFVGLGGLLIWAALTRRLSLTYLLGAAVTGIAVTLAALVFFSPLLSERISGRERVSGSSAAARTAFWGAAVDMTLDHPVVGVGPERFDAERERYLRNSPVPLEGREEIGHTGPKLPVRSAHSSYLEIAAEDGVPAAIAFCVFLFMIWIGLRDFLRDKQTETDIQGHRLAIALQGSLLAATLSGMFISGQVDSPFWIVAALAGALTTEPGLLGARYSRPSVVTTPPRLNGATLTS